MLWTPTHKLVVLCHPLFKLQRDKFLTNTIFFVKTKAEKKKYQFPRNKI